MDMNSYFGLNKIASSNEAQKASKELIESLRSGEIKVEILPNSYVPFSGALEEQDYLSFCRFLNATNGKNILALLEQEDE